jgi:hypothetical protein
VRVLLFFIFTFAYAQDTFDVDEFNQRLQAHLDSQAPLQTLTGIKPATIGGDYDLDMVAIAGKEQEKFARQDKEVKEFVQMYQNAVDKEIIRNPNIIVKAVKLHKGTELEHLELLWINKESMARLTKDPTAIQVLKNYGIEAPKNANEWIKLFENAITSHGFSYKGPKWANVVVGMSLGYPPIEADAYTRKAGTPEFIGTKGDNTSNYGRYTDQEMWRDQYYLSGTRKSLENYNKAREQDISSIILINDEGILKEDMPEYPQNPKYTPPYFSNMNDCMRFFKDVI